MIDERNGWREAYCTLRMFMTMGAEAVAINHHAKLPAICAFAGAFWWLCKANNEGAKP